MDSFKIGSFTDYYKHALEGPLDPRLQTAIRRMLRRVCVRVWQLENSERHKRHVDEKFSKIQEALANTLHHYTLLQENYDNLLRDSQERAANHPLKKGFRAVRHVMRLLHDRNRTQPVASNNKP